MNTEAIRADSLMHAFPAGEASSGHWWGFWGYKPEEVPGRVAVAVSADRAWVLKRGQAMSKQARSGTLAFVCSDQVAIEVEFEVPEEVLSKGRYPCTGSLTVPVLVPQEPDALAAFVRQHISTGGEVVYGTEQVEDAIRSAALVALRRAVGALAEEELSVSGSRICQTLEASPPADLVSVLEGEGLRLGQGWRLDLAPGAYSPVDEEEFGRMRADVVRQYKDREDPASQLIYIMTTLHNPTPRLRANLWLSQKKERPVTRGALDVIADAAHKDAGRFRRGDSVSLDIQCLKDAYVYLLDVGCDGDLSLLFPNELNQQNLMPEGKTLRVPDDLPGLFGEAGANWEVSRTASVGPDRLKLLAFREPVELLPPVLGRNNLLYAREAAAALPDVVAMVEKVKAMEPAAWTDAICQFEVVE